ncbi:MAG: chromate transporter [Phycisphaerales bacterium]|nr:chromate transporter [Phycisphaerales bacterium]
MHRVLIDERRRITESRFLHALNFCMLIPGPEAMQLATYLGWLKHRTLGGVMAGEFFVLPRFLAILAQAMVRIGRRVLKTPLMYTIAALSFVALLAFNAPFPAIIAVVAGLGLVLSRCAPAGLSITEIASAEPCAVPDHTRPTLTRAMAAIAFWLPLWIGPVIVFAWWLGPSNVFAEQAWFFSKAAVVTFGGAYSVPAYISQQAVEVHGWVTAGEMLTGIGFAETTPGPLIQVVQFVGYMGASRDPGALHPVAAGVIESVIVTWVTYMPCFLWVFLGGPYIERLRASRLLTAAVAAIPAAVVGVNLSLSVTLAAATLFRSVDGLSWAWLRLPVPSGTQVDLLALAIAFIAGFALFRLHMVDSANPRTGRHHWCGLWAVRLRRPILPSGRPGGRLK